MPYHKSFNLSRILMGREYAEPRIRIKPNDWDILCSDALLNKPLSPKLKVYSSIDQSTKSQLFFKFYFMSSNDPDIRMDA